MNSDTFSSESIVDDCFVVVNASVSVMLVEIYSAVVMLNVVVDKSTEVSLTEFIVGDVKSDVVVL